MTARFVRWGGVSAVLAVVAAASPAAGYYSREGRQEMTVTVAVIPVPERATLLVTSSGHRGAQLSWGVPGTVPKAANTSFVVQRRSVPTGSWSGVAVPSGACPKTGGTCVVDVDGAYSYRVITVVGAWVSDPAMTAVISRTAPPAAVGPPEPTAAPSDVIRVPHVEPTSGASAVPTVVPSTPESD